MRILHLINHCNKANGHVNVSVDMACTQSRFGHSVGYACSAGDFITLLQNHGVQTFYVPEPHRGVKQFGAAVWALHRVLKTFKPDVVHIHMAAQSALMQPFRLLGYKTVTTVHNEFDRSVWLMGLASRVVTVSKAGAEAMVRRGFARRKVRAVLNGTLGSPRLPAAFTVAEVNSPALLTVCGLHHRKGIPDLLHAFQSVQRRFPNASLYILGEGPSRDEYERLAQTLGIRGKVNFLGFRADPREYLHAADIFVLASHTDPGPLVIAEARNAGCAVVATNVDGIPEMLDHGAAGTLVVPQQPDLLAAAIEQLLADDTMLEIAKQRAKAETERFTVTRVCVDMEAIYREVI